MKKLRYKNLIKIFLVAAILNSCNDLEENNTGVIPVERLSAESLLEGAYGSLREDEVFEANGYTLLWGDSGVDIISSPRFFNQTTIDTNLILPTDNAALQMWQAHYGSIAKVNRAIAITTQNQNAGTQNLDEDTFNDIIAQERFLRALLFFNLVKAYERPVLATENDIVFDVNEIDLDNPAGNALPAEVYKLIEEDLLFASENLFSGSSNRATPLAAKGMLAKVYLTIAGLLKHNVIQPTASEPAFSFPIALGVNSVKNGSGTLHTANDLYTKALGLLDEVIDSGSFNLIPNFEEIFSDENNSETIFRVDFTSNGSDGGSQYGDIIGPLGNPPNGSFPGRTAQFELGMSFFDGPDLKLGSLPYEPTAILKDFLIVGGVYQRWIDTDVNVAVKIDGSLVTTEDVGELIEVENEVDKNIVTPFQAFQYPLRTSDQRFLVTFNTFSVGRINQTRDINDASLNERNGGLTAGKWRKELPSNSVDVNDRSTDYPLLRYADILLMKAEALTHLGTNLQGALDYVNMVRRRAYNASNGTTTHDKNSPTPEGMNLREDGVHTIIDRYRDVIGSSLNAQDRLANGQVVSNARNIFGNRFPQGNGNWDRYLRTTVQPFDQLAIDLTIGDFGSAEDILGAILCERRKEFAFEGHRRDDLIRNGVFEDVIMKIGSGTPSKFSTLSTRYTNLSINITQIGNNSEGTPSTDYDSKVYRFPIPQTEIANNPNLTQNGGY